YIQLRGLPRTALPADVQRAIVRGKLLGVSDVAIDYHRFIPTGRAYLTLVTPDALNFNLKALRNASISSLPITSASSPPPISFAARTRGAKGRVDAADRGLFGDGPRGGVPIEGKSVVLWGLPGRLTAEGLKGLLRNFKLAGTEGGQKEFVKLEGPEGTGYTRVSKHLIRMSSVSEAHRMVRALHMTYFMPDVHKSKYLIRCRVVY
ncbi:hypothetical protein PILCRDRAFT_64078, partial [Piloderma croceum F 1598]